MIALESHDDGVILPVRAQPGSRNSELRGEQDGFLVRCVTIEQLRAAIDAALVTNH
ncbi:MAG: hypothetical protein ABI614_11505 [Planctomycetota bacterium]